MARWTRGLAGRDGWWLALLALLCALVALPAAAQTFPKYTGLVVDAADVLPPATEQDLTAKLEALQKDTKRQLVVVTVPDTQGEALEVYANKLARSWGVGLRDINNGAVLLIAPGNPAGQRGPRIEVGYGLEPVLTDALSSVIIRQRMMPLIRQDVPGAVTAGADAIIQQLRASPEEAQARQDAAIKEFDRTHQRERASGSGSGFAAGVIGIMIFAFVILAFSRSRAGRSGVRGGGRRYRGSDDSGLGSVILWSIANEVANSALRGGHRGGGWGGGSGWGGGGGGSDGSWGGGGFTGGGGGDFGGGGASGDW